MSAAIPPEVRKFLTLALKRHDAGCKRFLSAKTMSGICGFDQGDLNAVAEWCEKRGLLTLPWCGSRYRHWKQASLDWDKARALLGGGA